MEFTFRPLRPADFPLLAKWLAQPHVARWWNHETSAAAVERDFGPIARGEEPGEDLLAVLDGTPVGLVQRSRLTDYPEYRTEFAAIIDVPPDAFTIDYLVGDPGRVGQGLGSRMISAVVADTWERFPEAEAVLVAVTAANVGSWRALEKAGARRVGSGEMEPDNPVDDPLHHVYRFDDRRFVTRAAVRADLERLGLRPGDAVLAHGALSRVGRLLNGPDAVVGGLLDAVSPGGTVLAYTDWDARYDELVDADGRVPQRWRAHVPPFDAAASRSARDNGALPEFLRTWPGALRSGNPGASVAAIGARAGWFTADHPLDYGYGPGSPLAKLVQTGGRVVLIGAPLDTMTLLHHAEHLADLPDKRVIRYEVPFAEGGGVVWRTVEEFDTADPVVDGFAEDYFATIVTAFLAGGRGTRGTVGDADAVLVDAAPMCAFAVDWMRQHAPIRSA